MTDKYVHWNVGSRVSAGINTTGSSREQVEILEQQVKSLQGQLLATQKMIFEQVMALQSQLESGKAYIANLEQKVASLEDEKGVQSPATESTGHTSIDSK
ncbi:hypothetical protein MP228_006950 [Amoeboaphelidium protococcarum]|nr:hypothetical protein MP228_006950 [Amoeboaphelidium protococcarum]